MVAVLTNADYSLPGGRPPGPWCDSILRSRPLDAMKTLLVNLFRSGQCLQRGESACQDRRCGGWSSGGEEHADVWSVKRIQAKTANAGYLLRWRRATIRLVVRSRCSGSQGVGQRKRYGCRAFRQLRGPSSKPGRGGPDCTPKTHAPFDFQSSLEVRSVYDIASGMRSR